MTLWRYTNLFIIIIIIIIITRELPGETDNAWNTARCTQARKATHGLDGQHQDVDTTLPGRVNQNDRDKWRKYVHGVANPRIEDG